MRGRRGVALPIVSWALVALAALSTVAALAARLDLALVARHRDHAAALAAAEAGLAEALAAIASDPGRAAGPDSVVGALDTGAFRALWSRPAGTLEVLAEGRSGTSRRAVEARIDDDPADGLSVRAWREVR